MEKRLLSTTFIATAFALVWLIAVYRQDGLAASDTPEQPPVANTALPTLTTGSPPPAADGTATITDGKLFRATLTAQGAALHKLELLNPQYFLKEGEYERPAITGDSKFRPGPMDLVSTWSFGYLPADLDIKRLEIDQKVTFPGEAEKSLLEAWNELRYIGEEPAQKYPFRLVQSDDRSATYVWPDPTVVDSPAYIEKRYRVEDNHTLSLDVIIHNLGTKALTEQFTISVPAFQHPASPGTIFTPAADLYSGACFAGDELVYEAFNTLAENSGTEVAAKGDVGWAGVASRYFLLAILPRNSANTQCSMKATLMGSTEDGDYGSLFAYIHNTQPTILPPSSRTCSPNWMPQNRVSGSYCDSLYEVLGTKPGVTAKELQEAKGKAIAAVYADDAKRKAVEDAYETLVGRSQKTYSYTLYGGPKDIDDLEAVGGNLSDALDFGMLSFLSIPMLHFLRLSHSMIPSWAIAIVLLTLLVKILTFPLTQKSFKQMQQMQKLKPKMDELKKKYGSDQQKLNQEMMALYKSQKVNPVGGCLPMLLQMPVWFALYQTIYSSVELYQAPLFGWVNNLAAPDPYFILPAILGITMFVQQRIMPTTMDSAQAKVMMWVMPIMFTVFMLFLPSGLVLYIFVNTVLSIGQQAMIQRNVTT